MDDLISRTQAVDAVEHITSSMSVCINIDECHGMKRMQRQAVIELANLPSAQPEFAKDKNVPSNDCVSRQAAIDCVCYDQEYTIECLEKLPSAQPEIIHCKECKYGVQDEGKRWYCRGLGCQVGEADGSGFCADAERRE